MTADTVRLTRRTALTVTGAGAVAATLAACAADTGSEASAPTANAPAPSASADATAEAAPSAAAGSGATPLAALADVPVGGSITATIDGQDALISQPTAGTVVAFSAICTHQGCLVAPDGGELHCPCHNSRFDAATGEVLDGPAVKPLPEIAVRVDGANIVAG